MKTDSKFRLIAEKAINSDKSIADTRIRLGEKGSAFQTAYIRETEIMPTQRAASADVIDIKEIGYVSNEVIRSAQTFPTDYDFINNSRSNVGYICGMSVPPLMIKRIVNRLLETNLFK